jgi:lysophospholipase L1-like esterase
MAYLEESVMNSSFECTKDKKNVFLIGDSIREGYCKSVKDELSNIANIFYINDNNRNTQFVITNLRAYCSKFNSPELVDIVHFNCGHWDIAHWNGAETSLTSIEEYARNLETIIELIKKLFVNAKIIFATTTSMNPCGQKGVNPRTTKEIKEYNSVAVEICLKDNVSINDLFEYVKDWDSSAYIDYCHYTDESNQKLGKIVAERLKELFSLIPNCKVFADIGCDHGYIAKAMLDSANIFCVLHGEYMSAIYTPIAFPIRLMVRSEDFEEAKTLLSNDSY